jgi:hypothetical protein
VIDGGWFSEAFTHAPQDVEVWQGRFHHHNVRPFLDIQRRFAQRFVCVRKIHLVRAAIPELRRAFSCLAKRSVKCRGKFRGITHNGRLIEPALIERLANRTDATVHHVARGYNIRACGGVRERPLHQKFDAFVIQNMKMVAINSGHTAVAVAHVFAEANVCDCN